MDTPSLTVKPSPEGPRLERGSVIDVVEVKGEWLRHNTGWTRFCRRGRHQMGYIVPVTSQVSEGCHTHRNSYDMSAFLGQDALR